MSGVEAHTRRQQVVGREQELARIDAFVGGEPARALMIDGEAGAGKTTLWEAGVESARGRGLHVFAARPSGAEAKLSFASLTDLFESVDISRLTGVPAPQRHALNVALLRADPGEATVGPRAIAMGLLNALRALSEQAAVVVAVDDVQWLDEASAEAIAFAFRRLEDRDVRFLLAKRTGLASALEDAVAEAGRLELAPLSLGAVRGLLLDRLGLSLPRRVLRQVFELSAGNPLYALELGRMLSERPIPEIGEELPVPELVEDLIGVRVAQLSPASRRLLLALALAGNVRTTDLEALCGEEALDEAVADGLLVVDGERVRPSHPLLSEAALARSKATERRALHAELAQILSGESLRARHLAMAATEPDDELAATVAAAAATAGARGATHEALLLTEHALRLTPPDSLSRPQQVLLLAHYLAVAGEKQRVTDFLSAEIESLPPGVARARAWLIMPGGVFTSNEDVLSFLEHALEESHESPPLFAAVLGNLSTNASSTRVERIADAEMLAEDGLRTVRDGDPEIERSLLYAVACARSLRGLPFGDAIERFRALSPAAAYLLATPERIEAQRLAWRGELGRAEAIIRPLQLLADERGEAVSYALMRGHLCDLRLRAGDWQAAAQLLDEWAEPTERETLSWPTYERCRALLAAGQGRATEAEDWAEQTIARARAAGVRFEELEGLRARGIATFRAHDAGRAAESLRAVWQHTEREGVEEPGAFPVAADLVEVLVELGELDEADAVTERIAGLAEAQQHPWAAATAQRCRGAIALARKDAEAGRAALEDATARYRELGLRFDEARALLAAGRGLRRLKKWAAARAALEQANAVFEAIGSDGWVEETSSELSRVGARRRSADGTLTPTERRVAELAAEGLSNKEIAGTLFVTVHTVEVHLSHAYAKLGIRSRSQLAPRLAAGA